MAELTADLFVTLDGFASGIDVGPYFGYSGPELESWVRDYPGFKMSAVSAAFFDEGVSQVGAVISGAAPTTSPRPGAGADRCPASRCLS